MQRPNARCSQFATNCRSAQALARLRAGIGRRLRVLWQTLLSYTVFRTGMRVGQFDPAVYRRQVVENSDFRKYDDNLRMRPLRRSP